MEKEYPKFKLLEDVFGLFVGLICEELDVIFCSSQKSKLNLEYFSKIKFEIEVFQDWLILEMLRTGSS